MGAFLRVLPWATEFTGQEINLTRDWPRLPRSVSGGSVRPQAARLQRALVRAIVHGTCGPVGCAAEGPRRRAGGFQAVRWGTGLTAAACPSFRRIEQVSWEPRAYIYHNFMSAEDCDHLVSLAKPFVSSRMLFVMRCVYFLYDCVEGWATCAPAIECRRLARMRHADPQVPPSPKLTLP